MGEGGRNQRSRRSQAGTVSRHVSCGKTFFDYVPQFKLVVAGNHKPGLRSVDDAVRRRFNLVPFTVTIPAPERDLELGEKLREEWGGILQWMIDGCLAWQCDGLCAPKVVSDATANYLASEDVLARWIEDRCDAKAHIGRRRPNYSRTGVHGANKIRNMPDHRGGFRKTSSLTDLHQSERRKQGASLALAW